MRRFVAALLLALAASSARAAVETTTVIFTVQSGVTTATSGTVTAVLSAPGTAPDGAGSVAVAGRVTANIATDGSVALVLVPNDVISPPGTYYTFQFLVTGPSTSSWTQTRTCASAPDPATLGDCIQINPPLGAATPLSRVQDEGIDLHSCPKLSFVGAGVAASYSSGAGACVVNVAGSVGGASAMDDLTDATITTPAAGASLIWNGSAWVDAPLDLADSDARTGILPNANTTATSANTPSTLISRDASGDYAARNAALTQIQIPNSFTTSGAGLYFVGPAGPVSWMTNVSSAHASYVGSGDSSAVEALNIFLGVNAGPSSMSAASAVHEGKENIGIGSHAMDGLTTGYQNLCIGRQCMQVATTARYNVGLGSGALEPCSTCESNTGVGPGVLNEITNGTGNTAVGDTAGIGITTGDKNTVIGTFADAPAADAQNRIAVGYGVANPTNNTAVIGNTNAEAGGTGTTNVELRGSVTSRDQTSGFKATVSPSGLSADRANTYPNAAGTFAVTGSATGVPDALTSPFTLGGTSVTATGAQFNFLVGVTSAIQTQLNAGATALTTHQSSTDHDSRYYTETELNASGGTINSGSNPVDWSRLKNVPAGFADGTDDGTGGGISSLGGQTGSTQTFADVDDTNVGAAWGSAGNVHTLTMSWIGRLAFARFTQGSALSVLGVAGNATADFASIAAASDGQTLRRSGTTLGFGALDLANANAVTGLLPLANLGGLGTGVATSLGTNVGSAGAPVVNGGALGTPSSGTLTNTTGFPAANLAGLGSGIATWLATPNAANLLAAQTGETGTGAPVFGTAPTIDAPVFTTKMNPPRVTAFPGSPVTGDVVIVTDDSAAGACDSAAGSARSWCFYTGSAWASLGDGGSGSGISSLGGLTGATQTFAATDDTNIDMSVNSVGTTHTVVAAWLGRLAFARFTQGSALSVLGVTGNATADFASIAASTDHQVLRRSGTALTFGAVNLAQAAAVTGVLPNANTTGASTNTPSTLVLRDSNGDFAMRNLTAEQVIIPANATDGQGTRLAEDSDHGSSSWGIEMRQTNLLADVTCQPDAYGKLPDKCLNVTGAGRFAYLKRPIEDLDNNGTSDVSTYTVVGTATQFTYGTDNASGIVYLPAQDRWLLIKNGASTLHGYVLSGNLSSQISTFDFPNIGTNVDSESIAITDPYGEYFYIGTESITPSGSAHGYVLEYRIADALAAAGGNISPTKMWQMPDAWCTVGNDMWEGLAFVPDPRYGPTNYTTIPRGYFFGACQGSDNFYTFTLDTDSAGVEATPTAIISNTANPCGWDLAAGFAIDYEWETGRLWWAAAVGGVGRVAVTDAAGSQCLANWQQNAEDDVEGIALGRGYLVTTRDNVSSNNVARWTKPELTRSGLILGSPTLSGNPILSTSPSANDNDTSVATTAYVQTELNAAGGRSVSCASGTCDADAEVFTRVENISISAPDATTDDALVQLLFPTAVTITRISCSTDTGTVDIQFDERAAATPNTGGTDVMTAVLVCDNNEQATTSFTNATIASRVPMSLDLDAVASAPTKLRIAVEYTVDD